MSAFVGTLLDRELALTRVGGDAELLKEIASLFLEDYPLTLAELRDALNRGDATKVERAAHGLKGSVSNFGAKPAVEAARNIENLGRAHQLAEVGQVLTTLELALAALRPELESL
jgi:HPt (histidine-containing phosphotransfer) domain-containing protein